MSATANQFDAMHAAQFDQFAVPATAQRGTGAPVATRVIVTDGVAQLGVHGQVIGQLTKVMFIRSEYLPQRGDLITIDGVARKLDAIDTDDGMIVEAVLHG